MEEAQADMIDDHEDLENEDANVNYKDHGNQSYDRDDNLEDNAQNFLQQLGMTILMLRMKQVRTFETIISFYSYWLTVHSSFESYNHDTWL